MSNSDNSVVGGGSTGGDFDDKPLWQYVTKLEKVGAGGGNWKWRCNYCNTSFRGSYSRVKAHILRIAGMGIKPCHSVTRDRLTELQRITEQAELRAKASMDRPVPLPTSSSRNVGASRSIGSMFSMPPAPSTERRKGTLEKSFNTGARDELCSMIARLFYSSGLPFNLARNPLYAAVFTYAANSGLSSFVPPGYNMLRTSLLQKERANLERLLQPIKDTWSMKGVSIVSDGWSDAQRRPIINFMAVTESGPMFLRAENAEGLVKSRHYIAAELEKVIKEVGPQNVVQVITDNAASCKAAGAIIEGKYPHIFWTPCVVHTLNLALKNICAAKNTEANEITYEECSWITNIADEVIQIKNFVMNHSMRLSMFNKHSKLKMLSIAETRFASVIIMLRRFKTIRRGLQEMVLCDDWCLYREDDVGKAQVVKEKILNDLWWDKIEYIISFTEPIYEMLRVADTDKPCLHLVYDMWDTMIEKVKGVIFRQEGKRVEDEVSSFYEVVHKILVDRWNKSNTPLHCMAHFLNPRYYSKEWLSENLNRVPPHEDEEISLERMKCIRRYFPSVDERRLFISEFAKFTGRTLAFGDPDSIGDRGYLEPKEWWLIYGASAPRVQTLALKLLGQPCSSSCCERNWSTYSFIHSVKRNKMTPERAEDLVFVHSNLRLLSRSTSQYREGETKMWDLGGDAFDSLEGAGVLEVADLSLDGPDLESMIFSMEMKMTLFRLEQGLFEKI